MALLFYKNIDDSSSDIQIAKNEIITKENPIGIKRQVKLPDGSDVWLNANSHISYESQFTDSSRIVALVGEVYFEVVKDGARPFQVKSQGIVTTALGTTFNVNAYQDNQTSIVSLAEGRVKVELVANGETLYLNPGYAAIHQRNENGLDTHSFDVELNLSWKDGVLIFRDAAEKLVFNKLENSYGVVFVFKNQSPQKWNLTTKFKNETLEEVLKVISFKMNFDFKIDNKTVTINYSKN
ncbi:MAG: transmembrane sensor [Cyclobacteriaceae bacterium]